MIEFHVPGSSFPRGLRVSRALLARAALLALVLALAIPSPAAAQPEAEGDSGEAGLTRLLDWMLRQRSSSPGAVELYRAIRPLAPGASERLPFSGGEPGQVLIVDGFCDQACTDMDIVMYGEDGTEVGADRAPDDVPIVEVPAGTYEVEVTMATCSAPECLYGILIVGADERAPIEAASGGSEEGVSGEESLTRLLDWLAQQHGSSRGGAELYRAIRPLAPGASEKLPFSGGQSGQVLIIDGFCDDDCTDIDIAVYAEGGEEAGADRMDDDVPIVEVPAGSYDIEVSMVECGAPECLYGLLIVAADEGTGAAGGVDLVSSLLDLMSRDRAADGAEELRRITGSLAPGASERFAVEADGSGGTLFLDGMCDESCTDMDLVVYGEDGEEAGADRLDDDVPIVEVPAGTYQVEVSMIECTAPACGYGVLVSAGTGAPTTGGHVDFDDEASATLVSGLLDIIVAERAAAGAVELRRVDGSLPAGGSERFRVEGGEPGQVLVLDGVCDESCTDVDLVVYDEDGEEAGADQLSDDVPIVEVPAGSYDVEVRMIGCSAPECLYGVVVFAGQEGVSEVPIGSEAGTELALDMVLDMLRTMGEGEGLVEVQRTSGELAAGASERLEVPEAGRNGRLFVAGVCDQGCTDFDLVLYDAEGNVLTEDRLDDDNPMVDSPKDGASIGVEMVACDDGPCEYSLILMTPPEE